MASEFVRKVKGIRNIDILSPNITTENDLISTIDGEVYVATNKGYRKITGVETKEIKQLKTDVSNLKIQSDTNTLTISDNTDELETNTSEIETNKSEIETLKTSTGNNTSEIDTLKTSTGNNTSDIETLKTSTDNNTSGIETLKTSTETNTSDIDSTQALIEQLQKQLNDLKENTKQYYTLFEGNATGLNTKINLNDSYKNYSHIKIHVTSFGGNDIKEYEGNNNDSKIMIFNINVTDSDGNDGDIMETQINRTSDKVFTINNQVAWRFKTQAGQEVTNGITITKIEGVK